MITIIKQESKEVNPCDRTSLDQEELPEKATTYCLVPNSTLIPAIPAQFHISLLSTHQTSAPTCVEKLRQRLPIQKSERNSSASCKQLLIDPKLP